MSKRSLQESKRYGITADRQSLMGFMSNPKDKIHGLLRTLSESMSHKNIDYHRYVLEKVQRGLQRAESEGAVTHADARARFSQWLAS